MKWVGNRAWVSHRLYLRAKPKDIHWQVPLAGSDKAVTADNSSSYAVSHCFFWVGHDTKCLYHALILAGIGHALK